MLQRRINPSVAVIRMVPVLVALAGCQLTAPAATTSAPSVTNPILAKLAESAERTSAAVQRLAEIENAKSVPPVPLPDVASLPPELGRPVSIVWEGPIEPLVQSLARQAGYAYRAIGAPATLPIVVRISAENRPLAHVLADAGYQAGNRATVRVSSDVIELVYGL